MASLFPAGRLGLAKAVIIYFRARTFAASIPTLLAPGIILGGILFGVFTATEAPGIAVLYTLLLTVMHYRSIRISELPVLLLATARLTGVVVGLVGMASAIARVEMRRLFYPMAPFIVILASLPGISLAMPRAFGGYLGPWVQRPGATHQPRPI